MILLLSSFWLTTRFVSSIIPQMDWFKIEWKGAYPIETAQSKLEASGFGVYAIYKVTGRASKLLYIGEVYWQSFARRLQQHKREWLYKVKGRLVICFGTVGFPQGGRTSHSKVLDVKSALIYIHKPPFNKASKRNYFGRDILILNLGKIGTLQTLICHPELKALLIKAIRKTR